MTDRYRYPTAGRSSATFNPARVSLPAGIGGYGSVYSGEADFVSSPTRYTSTAAPRGYTTTTTATTGVPAPSRTYTTVNQEPRPSRPSTREPSRNRRSTVDSAARPPPIIITTMQDHRPHASSPHSSDTHGASPVRDGYRSSDGKLYSQPASSIRSRSTARPYHASSASEDYSDYGRQRDRGEVLLASRDVDAYRSSRPSVLYPSDPRHSNAAIDYGDDGYQYTNAGELVRYDLDHGGPQRSRRHESFDRGYSRPNVNYNADQRSFNVNTTHDPGRTGRLHDSRGGPPPSTRGFDKINRTYDGAREIPPAAPVPPVPTPAAHVDAAGGAPDRREGRRSRPVSLTQEPGSRLPQPEDYYRDYEAAIHDTPRFHDDSVAARGFGIRLNPSNELEDRHGRYREPADELRRDEPVRDDSSRRETPRREGQKASDEEFSRESDMEREEWYRGYRDDRRDGRRGRRGDDEEDGDGSRVRDKMATGLGITTAAAVGLPPPGKGNEKVGADREGDRERLDARPDAEARERNGRDTDARLEGEAVVSASDSDGGRRTYRRHRPSSSFDPNDTSDLRQLKEQFATMNTSDKDKIESAEAPTKEDKRPGSAPGEESRGGDLVVVQASDEKQVRVVSPPREKKDEKPLKGILKQPSARFPEEVNPMREGVAPHKEDKKLKEVPSGARWTKINRKIVNPEALEVGKERFEVRDDFVIVLRVLSKEEIQAYAAATQVLRERRRNKENGDRDRDRDYSQDYDRDYDRDHEDERGRRYSHRHRRHRDEADGKADDGDQDRDRDRERRRRHRREDEDEYGSRSRDLDHHHHRRSHRET